MGELYRLDFPNGKSYIGMTTEGVRFRFGGHKRYAEKKNSQTPVHRAWRKHGQPVVVLLAVVDDANLPAVEELAIKEFGTLVPNGYNVLSSSSMPPMSHPDVAAKMRGNKHTLGKSISDSHKAAIGEAARGNCHAKGKKHPEHAERMKGNQNAKLRKEFSVYLCAMCTLEGSGGSIALHQKSSGHKGRMFKEKRKVKAWLKY